MTDDTQEIQVKFIPGEHCFLENIQIQLREIKVGFEIIGSVAIGLLFFQGEECMTIIFYAGPEL